MTAPVRANLGNVTATLPSLSKYLGALPHGLDSYPDARAKASLYRSVLDQSSIEDVSVLPEPLRRLVTNPAPVSAWIPEVHSHALISAVRDICFESDAAFIQHMYDRQRGLFDGRLYRILLALASPSLLLRTAALRWSTFHRGSTFSVESTTTSEARVRIDHPPHLWDDLITDALVAGLEAVLDLSGAVDTNLLITEREPSVLRLHGTWQTRR